MGIDPGSTVTAYGVVSARGGAFRYVASGMVSTSADEPMGSRLARIHRFLVDALAEHKPEGVAIEAIFRHKSSESALKLGQARGVALLAAAQAGHEAVPYNPMTVKRTTGATGKADKEGLARVVGMLLGVRPEGPHDVTDALAIAITHLSHRPWTAR